MQHSSQGILKEIQTHQELLSQMVAGQRERLGNQEVYSKSCELDLLINAFLVTKPYRGYGQGAED